MRWLFLVVLGCSGGSGGDDTPGTTAFDQSTTQVVFEIDYEQGQEPFTGPILGFGDTFDIFISNTNRLFAMKKMLTIPNRLDSMENIGDVADEQLTTSDILALADKHRDQVTTDSIKTIYIVFVSGNFADSKGVQQNVLGVSLGGTGVIAMFKDVIRSTNLPAFPNVVRFVEQSTLVHEAAHALGLVDNGVPLTTSHKDSQHGAHCNNDRCVMYYLNEGASDAAEFARMFVISGNSILFDDGCLGDVDALTGGP